MKGVGRGCGLLILLGILAFVSLMLTILLSLAIWPGEAKLTAPIFCDDAHPDAFVVSDTSSVRPGETYTNFTLYCLGPNGEAQNAGWMGPFLALWAGHALLLLGITITFMVVLRLRRARPIREDEAPPAPASFGGSSFPDVEDSGFPIAPPPP